jgi:ribonuclease P protein component
LYSNWNTLKHRSEIKELFRKGKRIQGIQIKICFLKNSLDFSRLLFCPEKVGKSSVQRNKIKRVLKALLRDKSVSVPKGFDIAIIAPSKFSKLNYLERKKNVIQLMNYVYSQ